MRWKKHPWKRTLHPEKSPPRQVVLPAEDSLVVTNGHPSDPEPSQDAQEPAGATPEKILVFPASAFSEARDTSLRPFVGFRTDAPEMAIRLFPRGVSSADFRERTKPPAPNSLESDLTQKQVVACVVPWHAPSRQVWTFRRGRSEGRLDGKVSCLVGGHVNLQDAYPEPLTDGRLGLIPNPDLLEVTYVAAVREMGEELPRWQHGWKDSHSDCRLILMGVVHDLSTPVDQVHFGIIYRLDVPKLKIPVRFAEEAGEAAGWWPVERLADPFDRDQVENWSVHVARHLWETSPVRHGG